MNRYNQSIFMNMETELSAVITVEPLVPYLHKQNMASSSLKVAVAFHFGSRFLF